MVRTNISGSNLRHNNTEETKSFHRKIYFDV